MKRIITLVALSKARVGYEFLHYGGAEECAQCNLAPVCIENLEKGRKYRVMGLRPYEHPCRLEERARVVEVEESETLAAMEPRGVVEGSQTRYSPVKCDRTLCPGFVRCRPEGLRDGDRCEVKAVVGPLECPRGLRLLVARLKRTQVGSI